MPVLIATLDHWGGEQAVKDWARDSNAILYSNMQNLSKWVVCQCRYGQG